MKETLPLLKVRGDETAIINQKNEKISFGELHDSITKLSYLLQKEGIGPDSKVLILAALDWPLYAGIASLFQLGATVVLVDPWATSSYIEGALSQVNPEFLIISKKARFFYLKKPIRSIPRKILLEDLISSDDSNRLSEAAPVEPDKSALITFTSGTTGVPKGFDRSHGFLLSQQEAHDEYFQHHPHETDLTMYPVFVLSNLKCGLTSVLIKGNLRKIDTIKIYELYDQIINHNVESVTLSPVILEKLLIYCFSEKKHLPLKKVFTGGAPVKKDICEYLQKVNPETEGYIVYGSTEAEPIALIPMKEYLAQNKSLKLGTPLGRVVPKLKWKIVPLEEKIHPYHEGTVGDVHLTGKFVGKRYWNNEKAFIENKVVDEHGDIWHKTGDIASLIDDQLFMLGRKSFPIKTSSGLLFPVPVENQIDTLSGVKKCAYFSLKNKVTLAYSGTPSARSLIENFFRNENLPIDEIIHIPQIPMDSRHRSKIDLPGLIKQLEGNIMVTHNSPLSSRLLAYTKERFPLVPVMILVFLMTSAAANLMANFLGNTFSWGNTHLWVSIITVFLFMLQLRMSDEIKDFDKDKMAYPERILSQGIITLNHVRTILYSVIGIQFAINIPFGIHSLIMLVILQIYAWLMAKEFFAKEFLEKKIGIYLISHQIILIPLMIYSALAFSQLKDLINISETYLPLLFLSIPYTVYELSRKTWSKDRENENADSYTKFWGIKRTVFIEILLAASILVMAKALGLSQLILSILFFLVVVYGIILGLFTAKPERKMSKMVELGGSILLLGHYAVNTFAL